MKKALIAFRNDKNVYDKKDFFEKDLEDLDEDSEYPEIILDKRSYKCFIQGTWQNGMPTYIETSMKTTWML